MERKKKELIQMEFKFQGNLVEFKEKHRAGKLPVTASQRGKETESQRRGRHEVAGSTQGGNSGERVRKPKDQGL